MGDTYDFRYARIEHSTINIKSTIQQQLASIQALHQLPAPPADFTGREAELTELEAAMADGGAAISGLRGMGGVGKTALALVLAHRLCGRYPDAQVYLDLQGTSRHPLTPADAMAHVVRAFQPQIQLPDAEAELASLYRSLLHGKHVLLLMDNAAGRAQVEPLIPPPGCVLLITSRRRFVLPGLHPLNLDALPEPDAQALLRRISARIASAAEDLALACGCLPLALRAAGSALAEREDLPVHVYLDRLRRGRERLDKVDASLTVSYELLTDHPQLVWRLLSVFPGTFDSLAAQAICSLEPDDAQDALSELVRYSLVDWDSDAERYRLQDLARDFARRRQTEQEHDESGRRHASYYLRVIAAANDLYLQGGDGVLAALRLFDLERHNIEAGQAWAAARAEDDADAARLCRSYVDVGSHCIALRLRAGDRVRWLVAALQACQQAGDRREEAAHLGNLGLAYSAAGDLQTALVCYQQSLAIASQIGAPELERSALHKLGNYYFTMGQPANALLYYSEALLKSPQFLALSLSEVQQREARRQDGALYGSLGLANAALGDAQEAIECHQQALTIAREMGDRRGEGAHLVNLGLAYRALGKPAQAIAHYEHALLILREIGDRRAEGADLGNLGLAYSDMGHTREAIRYYEEALAIHREIGDRGGEANQSWNLGLLYQDTDPARAADLMQICVDYERQVGHPDAEADAARVADLRRRIDGDNA